MPQLDSLVLLSQAQIVLIFFLGYFLFFFKIMPIIFVFLSISNEFPVYKYYKHEMTVDCLMGSLLNKRKNLCYCLTFISHLEKYDTTIISIYLGE